MTSPEVASLTATSNKSLTPNRFTCWWDTQEVEEVQTMKVKPSVKKMCDNCKVIKRNRRVMVLCTNPRHKQRQG